MGYCNATANGHELDKNAEHYRDARDKLHVIVDNLHDGDRVLDFGCYNGSLGFLGNGNIDGKNFVVDGLDETGNMLAKYHDIKDAPAIYDAIIAIMVFEHVEDAQVKPILADLARISRKLIIEVPNTDNVFRNFWSNMDHKRPRDNPIMLSWLNECGWTVKKIIKNEWRQKHIGLLPSIFRFVFNVMMQKSPYWGFMIVCEH